MRPGRATASVVLTAVLLLIVCTAPASAYRRDMHYEAKFAIALADSWSWVDATTIAKGDFAIDANHDTTDASLEAGAHGVRQVEQNSRFHCFSRQNDEKAVAQGTYNRDVGDAMRKLEKEADDAVQRASQAEKDNASNQYELATRARIAIGVYLHCQED